MEYEKRTSKESIQAYERWTKTIELYRGLSKLHMQKNRSFWTSEKRIERKKRSTALPKEDGRTKNNNLTPIYHHVLICSRSLVTLNYIISFFTIALRMQFGKGRFPD